MLPVHVAFRAPAVVLVAAPVSRAGLSSRLYGSRVFQRRLLVEPSALAFRVMAPTDNGRPQKQAAQCRAEMRSADGRSRKALYADAFHSAKAAVEKACLLCLSVQSSFKDADAQMEKADKTEVTVADFGVQALLSLELATAFPDIPLVAEEDAHELRAMRREREAAPRQEEELPPQPTVERGKEPVRQEWRETRQGRDGNEPPGAKLSSGQDATSLRQGGASPDLLDMVVEEVRKHVTPRMPALGPPPPDQGGLPGGRVESGSSGGPVSSGGTAAGHGNRAQSLGTGLGAEWGHELGTDEVLAAIDRGRFNGDAKSLHWCLDPIDGTRGFIQGDACQYVVSLALIEDGRPVVGVLGMPNLSYHAALPSEREGGNVSVPAGDARADVADFLAEYRAKVATGEASDRDVADFLAEYRAKVATGEASDRDVADFLAEYRAKVATGEASDRDAAECQHYVGTGVVAAAVLGGGTWASALPLAENNSGTRETKVAGGNAGKAGGSPKAMKTGASSRARAGCPPVTVPLGRWHVDKAAMWSESTCCISDHEVWDEMAFGTSVARAAKLEDEEAGVAAGDGPHPRPICCGSICKYAAVAAGQASVFVQHPVKNFPQLKTWDHAAGVIIVEEAGGKVRSPLR
eukprot:jgi/Mesvir1/7686/Mv11655-RA.2